MSRAASRASASASTVTGSSLIMSATLARDRLAQAVLEVAERLEEDDAAEEADHVRQVQVAPLLVGDDEVGLRDDADAAPAVVDHRDAGHVVLAQDVHHVLDGVGRRAPSAGSESMISRTVGIAA